MPTCNSFSGLRWLLLFALTDVQSEDSWLEKPTFRPVFTQRPFMVAWNAPTQDCPPRFKVRLNLGLFDLHASPNEGFVDQNLTIFYHERLGLYPYFDSNGVAINGGVPQNASLRNHLDRLQDGIQKYLRSPDKDGLAVIDWEEWRPIWVRNWNNKDIYRTNSRQLVALKHPTWTPEQVNKQAQYDFENEARFFMTDTLRHAKNYRPRQLWGFYLFPDCYNHDYIKNNDSYTGRCPDVEKSRNDQLSWMWEESTALYPSIYMDQMLESSENGRKFVRSRVREAMRISQKHHKGYSLPVFVYTRPTYMRKLDLLSQTDLISTIGESAAQGAAGAIFWGDAEYTKSKESCQNIKTYIEGDLGRYIVNVTTAAELCSHTLCNGNGRCLRRDNQTNAFLHLNPASFRIVSNPVGDISQEPLLHAEGQLSADDIRSLREQFRCQCYVEWYGGSCGTQRSTQRNTGASWHSCGHVLLMSLVALFLALL
ncbi:hyaluronidase-2 [Bombina bombina]|uniref:hyaluronidase-2 n=1 Tax=Bombina bombina TaxID=8345 RepID=UPI00235ACA62|nr:hyaluronidase-2 [Bombina bombina]XP_053577043.1 hyaluronidase-2 [Bombina bombina]XP_053577044.1 hyaluronidase-2 [Bombina bombina]XP_053577045.1 hyaluronidase-2 [Bombina bombina]